jgi:hypothetical protein
MLFEAFSEPSRAQPSVLPGDVKFISKGVCNRLAPIGRPAIAHVLSSIADEVKGNLGCLPKTLSKFSSNSFLVSETCINVISAVSCLSKWGLPVSTVRSCHSLARLFPLSFFGNRLFSSSKTPGGKASYTYLLMNFPMY